MRNFIFIGVVGLLSLSVRADLVERYNEELKAGKAYPCPSKECPTPKHIKKYQYIFVDGFFGDVAGSKTNSFMDALGIDFEVQDKVMLRPLSYISISDNADILYTTVKDLRKKSKASKAIIISHSKGAAETLLLALRHPEIFRGGLFSEPLVSEAVLLDGAFNGTPLAELWVDLCKSDNPNPTPMAKSLCSELNKWGHGLDSLKPNNVKAVMQTALSNISEGNLRILKGHLWSVQSFWADFGAEWSSPLWVPHLFLNFYGENDGVILTADEKVGDKIGTNLGRFSFDHNAILAQVRISGYHGEPEAFARALVREMVLTSEKSLK